jgi:hypothetical protein
MTHLVIDPTEPLRRPKTLESAHRVSSLLDASIVLLQMILEILVGTMRDLCSQLRFYGSGIGIVSIGGDPGRYSFRDDAG